MASSYSNSMALMQGSILDEGLRRVLGDIVKRIPDDRIVGYARAAPDFQGGGFRLDRPATVRARMRQRIEGSEEIDDALRRLLARHSLNVGLIAPLSTAFLRDHRRALSRLFGVDPFTVGLLLDARSEVQALARDLPPPPPPGDAREFCQAAAAELQAPLRLLLTTLGGGHADRPQNGPKQVVPPVSSDEICSLGEQLRQCREELRHARAAAGKLDRLRTRLKERTAEIKRLQDAGAEDQAERRRLRRELERTTAAWQEEQRNTEARVRALTEARLASEFAGWLGPQRSVALQRPVPGDDLPNRAEQALRAQETEDRVSGRRAELRARLNRIESLLERGRDALANALRPLPQLQRVVEELRTESADLRQRLGLETSSTLRQTLAAAMNTAEIDKLPELQRLIDALGSVGSLSSRDADLLREIAHLRQARLQQAVLPPADGGPGRSETATPGERLVAALQGRGALVLLVDGHNLLFSLQARYLQPQRKNRPDAQARDKLVQDLLRMAHLRPSCRVIVVFDGPEYSLRTPAPNVSVIYSGGQGEHRADKTIIEYAGFLARESGTELLLTTNDNELARQAGATGTQCLMPTDLLPLLSR